MLDKNLIGIEPDFSKNSNYNPDANVAQVKFGADAPVLEVELNELQQVQDKAREDLIRSMIPSGFTKPVKIDFYHEKNSSNAMYTLEDAEAYVNGMRIFIPKGTRIDIGDSPTENAREDLVFLEVWKEEVTSGSELTKFGGEGQATIPNNLVDPRVGEETSRRIINKWRIRCANDVNFKDCLDGLACNKWGTTIYNYNVQCQGANSKPFESKVWDDGLSIYGYYSEDMRSKTSLSGKHVMLGDSGLFVAGLGDSKSIKALKTVDGYSLAIPMFKLYRRPNQGFSTGDYANISPLADSSKLTNLLQNEKLSSVATGEVDCVVEGNTMYNIVNGAPSLAIKNGDKVSGRVTGDAITLKREVVGDTGYILLNVPINLSYLKPDTDYTVVFNAQGKAECTNAYLNIMTSSAKDDVGGATYNRKVGLNVVHIKTKKDAQFKSQILYVSVDSKSGAVSLPNLRDEMTLSNFMLLEGKINEVDLPKYFKGFKSVGDYSVKLDRFVSWGAEVVNGTSQENIATIPVQLTNPYIKVVPVNLLGEEISDGNVAFRLFDASNRELGWSSCPNILYSEKYKEVSYVKVFCNSVANNNKISGFNIYTGNNIILKSIIDSNNESVMEIHIKEPLRSIPRANIKDLAFGDGRVCRKVAKGILDDNTNWSEFVLTSLDSNYLVFQVAVNNLARTAILSEYRYRDITSDEDAKRPNEEYLGLYKGWNNNADWIYLSIAKTKLTSEDKEGLKAYLREHPIVYYYQPKETYVEESLYPSLKNYDDFNGNITENLISVTKLDTFEWLLGTTSGGWTEFGDTIVFYSTSFEDNMQTTSNIFCDALPYVTDITTVNKTGIGNAVWENKAHPAIRIQKSLLSSPDVSGFKQWLKSTGIRLVYEAISPKMTKYPMEYAEVQGNLIFTNDSKAKVLCDSIVEPKVVLEHKAQLNLDLYKGTCYVNVEGTIPPNKLEIEGQTSNKGEIDFNLNKEVQKAPIKLDGKTLNNIFTIIPKNLRLSDVSLESDTFVIKPVSGRYPSFYDVNGVYKEDTSYTVIVDILENSLESSSSDMFLYFGNAPTESVLGSTLYKFDISNGKLGRYSQTVQTIPSFNELTQNFGLKMYLNNTYTGGVLKVKIMVIETSTITDVTSLGYFEGIKSFGEIESNKISILSRGKNLLNMNDFYNTLKSISKNGIFEEKKDGRDCIKITQLSNYWYKGYEKIKFKEKTRYTFTGTAFHTSNDRSILTIKYNDGSYVDINVDANGWNKFNCTSDANKTIKGIFSAYSTDTWAYIDKNTFMIEEDERATNYEPYKEDKKDILIKEPLRENDVLYEDNGQVKVCRDVKQYTFTGDESFRILQPNHTNTLSVIVENIIESKCTVSNSMYRMCNNFFIVDTNARDTEGYNVHLNSVRFNILKSKLNTPDVNGFKAWLKANPTTVIYQLAEPRTEVIKSVFNSSIHTEVDFIGQVGYKRTSDSGLDCGTLGLSPTNVQSVWTTGEVRLCTYNYNYGNIQDLVGIPMRLGGGYAYSTEHNFKILEVLSDSQVLVQNIGRNLPTNLDRGFYPSFICSTAQSEFTIGDLQKTVSLTGIDYNNLLEKLVCKHLY